VSFLDAAAQQVNRAAARRSGGGIQAFQGAASTRQTASWFTQNLSADFELRPDLRFLRARSRQVARDNPWMHGILWNQRANVLGPRGIIPQVRLREGGKWWDPSAPLDKKANAQVESFFRAWCEDPECVSIDGLTDWSQQTWFAEQTRFVDGEHFEFRHQGAANDFGFALQTLDADQFDEGFNVKLLDNGNEIRMSVEIDPLGRRVAYHVWDRHPNDLLGGVKARKRIPAEHIIHYFEGHRRTAVRGVPSIAAAILRLHMMGKHEEAELVASIASSAKMGWIQTTDGYIDESATIELDENGKVKPPAPIEMSAEPGLVSQLPPGYQFKEWDPQHPTSAFEPFQRSMLRSIGASVGQSYASTSGDLSAVNYSSIRAGLLTERDVYRLKQTFLATQYHRKVFRDVMRMAALQGFCPIPDERLPELFRSITWQGRGWKWVDPINDMQALQLGIKLGVMNRSDACAETGKDFEENLEVLRMERELALEAGVAIDGETSSGQQLLMTPRNDGSQDQGDGSQNSDQGQSGGKKTSRTAP
jgi:lambda family phage portal protein